MKRPNITKGPWDARDGLVISDDGLIADAEIEELRHIEKCKINAKAISAVPDMIEALMEAFEMHGNAIQDLGYNPSRDPTMKNIKKALKKAGAIDETTD